MKNIVSELDNKSYKVLEASDLHQFYEESRGLVPLDLNTYQLVDGSVYDVKKYLKDVDNYCEDRIAEEGDTLDMLVSLVPASHEVQDYMRIQSKSFELLRTVPLSNLMLSESQYNAWCKEFTEELQAELSGNPVESAAKETEKSAEKSEWAMFPMSKSLVKPVKNQQGVVSASIGLNHEHGQYGRMFFSEKQLKSSRENENLAFLPLLMDGSYKVVFGNSKDDRRVETMTGKQIVESNQVYQKEKQEQRIADLESMENRIREPENEVSLEK